MASHTNLSVVLHGKNDMRLEDWKKPEPGKKQLLIKVHTVGICGSDVHYWTHGSIGRFVVEKPMVLGHETSGTVVGMGGDVKGFKIGDRVAVEPGVPCRMCEFCKSGVYNLCQDMVFFATPPVHGSLAQYIVHDYDFCFKLPVNVSMEDGSLIEPLSVAIHSCRRAHITVGTNALVLGAGPIGLLNLLTAKSFGAAKVIVTDMIDDRLKLAKELGADGTINVKGMNPKDVAKEVIRLLDGAMPEASIECSGAQQSVETGILATKSGGILMAIGLGADRLEIPFIEATQREVDIRGVFRYVNCYPTAIKMLASGTLNLNKLTRAHYTLQQSEEAFKKFLKGDVVKVFIKCDSETQ